MRGTLLSLFSLIMLPIGIPPSAAAAQIYSVSIDTSSVAKSSGALAFNFGWFDSPNPNGLASISLLKATGGAISPAPITFSNSFIGGGAVDRLTYGSSLSFQITLDGDAINKPDPKLGGIFLMAFLYDSLFDPILSNDSRRGRILEVDVTNSGVASAQSFSSQTVISSGPSQLPGPVSVPEPAAGGLLLMGAAAMKFLHRRPSPLAHHWFVPGEASEREYDVLTGSGSVNPVIAVRI